MFNQEVLFTRDVVKKTPLLSYRELSEWASSSRISRDGLEMVKVCDIRSFQPLEKGEEVVATALVHAKMKHSLWYKTEVVLKKNVEGIGGCDCTCNKKS